VLTVEYGGPPWVAPVLAFSFGGYGLAKKRARADAVEGLTFETLVLAPAVLGYLIWLGLDGSNHFLGHRAGHAAPGSTVVVTTIPLLNFGAAAVRLPLTTLRLPHYVTPAVQFVLGVTRLDERMSPVRWPASAWSV
jgi:chloramphenicol-sensitive protein RarD